MEDGYKKYISLKGDSLFFDEDRLDDRDWDIYTLFKSLEELTKISFKDRKSNNTYIEISENLFDYLILGLTISEGYFKLLTHLHKIPKKNIIVLCLTYDQFFTKVKRYKKDLISLKDNLMRDLKGISGEIEYISSFDDAVKIFVEEDEEGGSNKKNNEE
ncbi:MAG: hypothetical protein ACMUJM_24465 [bacterium]